MIKPDANKQQQARRLRELFDTARQRYLDKGGDLRRTPSGRKGDDCMTDAERQEALTLMRQIFDLNTLRNKTEINANPEI